MARIDIAHHRLHNQRIGAAPLREPAQVVAWLVAAQAQDYAGAKWALGLRMQGATDGDIEQAFNDGSILRTHVMRPTWHFMTPADIRWLLALTAPRVHAANASMVRRLKLDTPTLVRSHAVLARALEGSQQLTRDELRAALQRAGIAVDDGLRMAYIMMSAELDGIVCSGARRGKQFTYALLEERVPPARVLEREEALAELARRYFTSRGPATVHDLAKWSGLTVADARRGLDAVKGQLGHEVRDGQTYWLPPSTSPRPGGEPAAHLLSVYDEYISGYKDRGAISDAEVWARLMAQGNALRYVIVVDGQIVGTWRRTLSKDAVTIEISLFTRLTEAENQAVALAAQRYGEFLELPVVLV